MADLGGAATRRTLRAGEVLCEEGAAGTDVYLVVSGALDVVRTTSHGELIVGTLGPGELVGEVARMFDRTRTATLRATEESVVEEIAQQDYIDWLDDHPEEAARIAADARVRLDRTRVAESLAEVFGIEDQDVVDGVVEHVEWITLAPGQRLFSQGDHADAAYFLIAGRLRLVATEEERVVLDTEVGRGEIVGEMGLIEDRPRVASAIAIRDTTLAMLSRESFEHVTTAHPALLTQVFRTVIDRLARRHAPDERARVVGVTITADGVGSEVLAPLIEAVQRHGRTLHVSAAALRTFVGDLEGPGGATRVTEFLHEADVMHDYVVLEGDAEPTPWSQRVANQADRFILLTSARPDAAERDRITSHLAHLNDAQRASAWVARLHPPGTTRPRRSVDMLDTHRVGEVHNLRLDVDDDFASIGRLATGNGVGIVLSGGGAKGFGHIGALKALAEVGIVPDRFGAASMGAVVAAFAGLGHDHAGMVDGAITEFSSDLLDYTIPLVSLVKAERMAVGLTGRFGDRDITDLWTPFYAVSTNITRSELAVHRRGNVVRVLRASSAIPVLLPPVPIDGDLHVDGGVLDNVPTGPMADDNSIGTIIAIDVSSPSGPSAGSDYGLSVSGFRALRQRFARAAATGLPDVGQTLMSSMLIGSTAARNASEADDVVDLYLDLDLEGFPLMKFVRHEEIVQRGYDEAVPLIAQWLATRDDERAQEFPLTNS